ncbi:hypothetical protein MNBD_ALPHA04-438 [hydrothermal vent metagenome]|uniref:HTH merR-type domain-containing protein n=1 Tax=hydrothermal vent metagenome TaxID=652676 RepID=A0A3B0RGN4_9ZZZZ
MDDSLTINEVVRRTGLSSRALRFYEARAMIAPLRTGSGRRIYCAADLERIHQIITLKKAGLTLKQIGILLDHKPINLDDLLRQQLEILDGKSREIATAQTNLKTALSRIENGELLDAATLCSLIKDGDNMMMEEKWMKVIDRYYSPQEQKEWTEHVGDKMEMFNQEDYNAHWQALSGRIEAAMPLDPASDKALGFVREWFTLLEPFSKVATPQMWTQSRKLYEKMPEWENDVETSFSSKVWQFIREATGAAMRAGKDIGPIPDWMRDQFNSPSNRQND